MEPLTSTGPRYVRVAAPWDTPASTASPDVGFLETGRPPVVGHPVVRSARVDLHGSPHYAANQSVG